MIFYFLNLIFCLNSYSFSVAISSIPNNLSPFFATDANSQNINRLVHRSLTDFNDQMKFECILCTSFVQEARKEQYIIKFTLKKGQKFWDGSELKAIDVKNSHLYFTETQKIKSIFRFAFSKIVEVRILNDYELELVYDKFSPDHLSNLSLLKIIKIKNFDQLKKVALKDIIGSGIYQLAQVSSLEILLTPSEKVSTRPDISFQIVRDETTLVLKLINAEVDLAVANISPRKIDWLKKNMQQKLKFFDKIGTNYNYIGINHKKGFLKDQRVRHALSLLIPRKKILKYKLKGMGVLANGIFSAAFKGLYNPHAQIDTYNPQAAISLLKAAGLKINADHQLVKDGVQMELDWKVSSNKSSLEIVKVIALEFENVGIKVNIIVQEWGAFMKSVKRGMFDLFIGRWIGFTGGDMLNYVFHSESIPPKGANRGFYKNTEVDQYIAQGMKEIQRDKRNMLFRKALSLILGDYAYINLWHPQVVWPANNCLKMVRPFPNGSFTPMLSIEDHCGKR